MNSAEFLSYISEQHIILVFQEHWESSDHIQPKFV